MVTRGRSPGGSAVAMSAVQFHGATARRPPGRLRCHAEAHLVVPWGARPHPLRPGSWIRPGATVQPTWYETTSRASWRRLVRAVSERSGASVLDLPDLADDTELVAAITGSWPTRP